MKPRPLHLLLIIAWASSLLLAGGCRRASPPSETDVQDHFSVSPAVTDQHLTPQSDVLPTPLQSIPEEASEIHPLLLDLEGVPFDRFIEESFKIILLRDPEWITSEGLSSVLDTDNARLTDISDGYLQENQEVYRATYEMLSAYDRASLTPDQKTSFDAYAWYLEDLLRMGEYRYHDYPINPIITGVQYQLLYLFTDMHPITDLKDARDYVNRLSQVDDKIEQLIEGLRIRQEKGIYPPQVAIQASLGGIQGIAYSTAEETPYYRTLQEKLDGVAGLSEDEERRLLEDARQAIDVSVIPAYRELAAYLEKMETIGTQNGGVWQQPEGEGYYQAALRHHTSTDLTPDEIHQLGLDALERIQTDMRQRFDQLGYPPDGTIPQLFQRVAQDGGLVQGQDILDGYADLIAEASQNLEGAFDMQPSAGVDVRPGPGSTAFYVSPAVDGSRLGVFYAPVRGSEPRFKMPTLAYHEGVPGHHFQISLAQEVDLPLFRRLVGFTGYTEGWALYAERLAEELGWYADDPYADLGRLQMEAFRAARLVVDTGLHAKDWSMDKAVNYLVENTGLERGFIQNEVVRYLVWPGQATSYAVGYFKLLELRQKAMDRLGDDFSLKDFHRIMLNNGSLPLDVLEQVVGEYVTLASLEQISDYPLYVMRYEGDYGFAEFLQTGAEPLSMQQQMPIFVQSFAMAVNDASSQPTWACTGFAALHPTGEKIMGRNFDWMLHPAMLLFTDPPDAYASVSMVDLYYLGYNRDVPVDDRQGLLRAPYLPFDGMNEQGLAVGMMAVSQADSGYDPAKLTISELNLIRLVLDYAATVDEAVALMGQYNIDFGGGPPLHYFLADTTGKSSVVEFVGGEMRVLPNQEPWQVSTNFLVSEENPVGASSTCWRYNQAYATLEKNEGQLSQGAAMNLLESTSQSGDYATRWSVVYNMSAGEISLVIGGDYNQVFSFKLVNDLPYLVRDAVEENARSVYTDFYSGEVGFDQVTEAVISRAWRARDLPQVESGAWDGGEVWCVQITVSGKRQGEDVSENPIWIAIKESADSEWSVQPLAIFSSLWPYESCGQVP